MHGTSYALMRSLLAELPLTAGRVIEIGSLDTLAAANGIQNELYTPSSEGSYRPLLRDWQYTGTDLAPGPGVDVVIADHKLPFPDNEFDLAISGQALEHMPRPWEMIREVARVLKPGGWCVFIAPWQWEIHRFPLDCFRILPDGMQSMMEDAGLHVSRCGVSGHDCFGVGSKQGIS